MNSTEATDEITTIDSVEDLVERFVIVYGMGDAAFDRKLRKLVPLKSVRNASVGAVYREWMGSREKKLVRDTEVGFDPACEDRRIRCNLWGGWPTEPDPDKSCEMLLELLRYLCSVEKQSDELYRWVLRWLAYPLQNPGAKMTTALVAHGPQGTGKNMFFEAYMAIFGPYGSIVDQSAIEDKFNDYLSRKLFLLADEVVARQELYHTKNRLKGLVTGYSIRINPKNMPSYEERNHVNMVFLSNEAQPLALERDDRRYAVIWTPPKRDASFYEAVRSEIQAGGVAGLHAHLLGVDLTGFYPWTPPPKTQAKAELIELGLDSTERFWSEWMTRLIPLPVVSCLSEDAYAAYRHYCARSGILKPAALNVFVSNVTRKLGAEKRSRRTYREGIAGAVTQNMVITPAAAPAAEDIQSLTDQVVNFREALDAWRKSRSPIGGEL